MKWINDLKLQLKNILNDIKQIKTAHEFLDYITIEKLSYLAFFFVMIWSLIPILLMILSLFYDRSSAFSFMFNSSRLTIIWYMLMQQIGFLGFIIVIIHVVKSIKDKKINHVPLKTYVLNHAVEILFMIFLGWSFITALCSDHLSLSFNGSDYRKDGWFSYLAYGGFFGLGYLIT